MKETRPGEDANRGSDFPVVGIGASAGGLEALREFLDGLSSETGMAFVVITHLSSEHKSALAEILQKGTKMPVSEIKADTPLEPDNVFVIPQSRYLSIKDGAIMLEDPPEGAKVHLPIDHFLSSLAEAKRSRAIGVILSGAGSDGTRGVKEIKAEEGITFAQSGATARFADMPRNAVASGNVDYVLSPTMIAHKLLEIRPRLELLTRVTEGYEESSKKLAFETTFSCLRARTGVDFTHYRMSTLRRRISRRMILKNLDSIEEYADFLCKDDAEVDSLFKDILINVTSFFRDPEAFQALMVKVLPRLLNVEVPSPLRVWVPACSTGEEAYSIAICILEYMGENCRGDTVQIIGTDVNADTISEALAGVYPNDDMENVSKERLSRFFTHLPDGKWQINKSVRDLCVFTKHDVLADPPFADVDLISCRNLLIYFDPSLQEKVIHLFHCALKPDGYLLLGKSESVGYTLFEPVDKENKIFSKKTPKRANSPDVSSPVS